MYRYAATDPRREPGRYFYAPFEGPAFLDAYRASRRDALAALAALAGGDRPDAAGGWSSGPRPGAAIPAPGSGPVVTLELLRAVDDPAVDPRRVDPWLGVIVRKLEVARVLRDAYGPDLRPTGHAEAHPDAYAHAARILARRATRDGGSQLRLLSTLLKAGDLLAWLAAQPGPGLTPASAPAAAEALEAELALVAAVIGRGIPPAGGPPAPLRWAATAVGPGPGAVEAAPGRLVPGGRVVLLAADTARARAYLHLLAGAGLAPDAAVLVTPRSPAAGPAPVRLPTALFDNETPLVAALEAARVPTDQLAIERLEDPPVLEALRRLEPALVVVAGPPGALLAPAFFAPGAPACLHVHPGRLPAYRGSTPMYYELLQEGRLTASALLLDEGIDTGELVAERGFEPPADRSTIDGAFDPWMRAVLLRDVLVARAGGRPIAGRRQAEGDGRAHHVIHPVLRHAALLAPTAVAR